MRIKPIQPVIVVFACATVSLAQTPLGSEFTYQGQLRASGLPAIAAADFQFALFGAAAGGNQIGSAIAKNNVAMSNGTFTVTLDFGVAEFNGQARWLEVSVRSPAGVGGFNTLAPRQLISSAPNATYSHQTRGITVDATGRVGIGTATPTQKLSVGGDMALGAAGFAEFRQLRVNAGNTGAFLFTASPGSLNLGFNHFIDESGLAHTLIGGGASRISLGHGSVALALSAINEEPLTDRIAINTSEAVFFTPLKIDVTNSFLPALHIHGAARLDRSLSIFDDNDNQIWTLGHGYGFNQPTFFLISPVTSDVEAGFFRDPGSGNGVMIADDKNFRAPNPSDASTDIWYCCPEGPEAAMYVRGTARLTNGRATIQLPDHFRNLASEPGMTIQLTPISIETKGLGVIRKSLNGIEVGELSGGTGDYEFDWRVEAVRKGWEDYKVIRPWLRSDEDPDKAWQNRLKHIEERRAHGKPSPVVSADTPRPSN